MYISKQKHLVLMSFIKRMVTANEIRTHTEQKTAERDRKITQTNEERKR
jgi:hypothetical protein